MIETESLVVARNMITDTVIRIFLVISSLDTSVINAQLISDERIYIDPR